MKKHKKARPVLEPVYFKESLMENITGTRQQVISNSFEMKHKYKHLIYSIIISLVIWFVGYLAIEFEIARQILIKLLLIAMMCVGFSITVIIIHVMFFEDLDPESYAANINKNDDGL